MPKRIVPLVAADLRGAKPGKLFDGGGLYLQVTPAGGRWWRLKYRHGGVEKQLSLGVYPATTLASARRKRDEARALIAAGVDPSAARKAHKAAQRAVDGNAFETIALEWHATQSGAWTKSHADRTLARMRNDVFPWIGTRPIAGIKRAEILDVLRRIEARGAVETAHRILQVVRAVFTYAQNTARVEHNPAAGIEKALKPVTPSHHAAIVDPDRLGELLRAIDSYEGTFVTRCALKLGALTFVRPGELRAAEWSEFDLDAGDWSIPAARMKTRQAHLVPLAPQAVAILRELHAVTGTGRYVFPNPRSRLRPMSSGAVLAAFRRMGFDQHTMSGHGWRATARTILDERLGERVDLVEHQLAHAVRDPNGRAYNRTAHLAERRKMMARWADYLDSLRKNEPA
jgi:integrase